MDAILEKMDDPFQRLSWCIDEYFRKKRNDDHPITHELNRFDLITRYPHDRLEQVRTYCELMCTTFPTKLVEPFSDYVLSKVESELADTPNSTVEDITEALGFVRARYLPRGPSSLVSDLDEDVIKLNGYSDSGSDLRAIKGIGANAFDIAERALQFVISFYGQWIATQIDPTYQQKSLANILANAEFLPKEHKRVLKKWVEENYRPGITPSVELIRFLNQLVSGENEELTSVFQEVFASKWEPPDFRDVGEQSEIPESGIVTPVNRDLVTRSEIVPDNILELFKVLQKEFRTPYFIHEADSYLNLPPTGYRELTYNILGQIGQTLRFLSENIIPPVVVVQRRMTFHDGIARFDCLLEDGTPKHYRFFAPLYFYPNIDCFFFLPFRKQQIQEGSNLYFFEQTPLIFPVDLYREVKPI